MKVIIWFIAIVVFSLGGFYVGYNNEKEPLGSTVVGNDYTWVNMSAPSASSTVLYSGLVSLGSVVIVGQDDAVFTVQNASSTTDLTAETIAVFEASATEGTYTFDSQLTKGLMITTADKFNGQYIVTYRR